MTLGSHVRPTLTSLEHGALRTLIVLAGLLLMAIGIAMTVSVVLMVPGVCVTLIGIGVFAWGFEEIHWP